MAVASDSARIAASVRTAREYLNHHPDEARSTDPSARATVESGLRTVVEGPNSWRIETDMATGVGGGGSAPSPGWLLRSALASCDAVLIAMQCAVEGVTFTRLEAEVISESDDRGLLGLDAVPAGPLRMGTTIRIEASDTPPVQFDAIVERALRRSPVADAIRRAVPVTVNIALLPAAR